MILKNKTFLITGGTGSFGNCVIEKLLQTNAAKKIIVFSRDEKKQYDMRNKFKNNILKFVIGDVRDKQSLISCMKNIDYVFHAAALKQVPSCEFFPLEAVKTNILGASNVIESSIECNAEKVIILSTDKAVYPINAMGMSKALMEKIMLAKSRENNTHTTLCGVRYGNVMYSRGSVIPLFIDQIKAKQDITITNPDMTRFLLPLPVAIDLVFFAMEKGQNGDMLVRKAPAATIDIIAQAIMNIFNYKGNKKIIGTREGEKVHETLVTKEELVKSEQYDDYFRIRNISDNYDNFFSSGMEKNFINDGYTSENTTRLSLEETTNLILSLEEVKQELKK